MGVEDLILLEPLDEESLIKNLQVRYENNEIYVSLRGSQAVGYPGGSHIPPARLMVSPSS